MTSTTSPKTYVSKAQIGESLRLSGNYSEAIRNFTSAIEESPTKYSWAHAHRAAARSGLGDYVGALDDFLVAADYFTQHNPGWLLAQAGELCRLWARASFTEPTCKPDDRTKDKLEKLLSTFEVPKPRFAEIALPETSPRVQSIQLAMALMGRAIEFFRKALFWRERDPWTYAHLAATHTLRYWTCSPFSQLQDGEMLEHDFTEGTTYFEKACALNTAYGWAYAFHAVLLGLKEAHAAVDKIGKAYMSGMDRQVPLMRSMASFSVIDYARRDVHDIKTHATMVGYAWNLLQAETDEVYARYYVADGLHLLKSNEKSGRNVQAAINRARVEVNGMKGRALAMEGGLACMEGRYDVVAKLLTEIFTLQDRTMCDLETLTMIAYDAAWAKVRDPSATAAAEPGLQDAHEAFKKLFNFSP